MDNDVFNELNQFSKQDAEILKSLREIGEVEEIIVRHVDFENGDIIISISDTDNTFKGMMSAISFCALSRRMRIKSADFDTGEIKVNWLPNHPYGLTPEEIELVKQNKKIDAIKAVRKRTDMGLADAKNHVEKHWHDIQADRLR